MKQRTVKVPFLSSVGGARSWAGAAAFALGAVVLFGCPVYSGDQADVVCDSQGNCCDEISGNCSTWNCDYTEQCPNGAFCSSGICVSGTYDGGEYYTYDGGYDGGYDAGDEGCPDVPCQPGYTCTLTNSVAQCLPTQDAGPPPSDAGSDVTVDATHDANPPPVDAGHDTGTPDAHDSGPTFPPFTGCTNDNACVADSGVGARCLDGVCVSAANQCFDSTQCPSVGGTQEQCVQGVCTPSCANGASCPAGYSCNTQTSVCTGNPTPCGAANDGGTCASGDTCVDEHCVPICTAPTADAAGDAGSSCAAGLVCIDHGCIPDQKPTFVCAGADGTQSTCANGSVCLHHNCYIGCSLSDAGGDAGNSCRTADNFNVCKPVTTSSGTVDVCGSSSNLGNQCGPTGNNQGCNGGTICIDGYCE